MSSSEKQATRVLTRHASVKTDAAAQHMCAELEYLSVHLLSLLFLRRVLSVWSHLPSISLFPGILLSWRCPNDCQGYTVGRRTRSRRRRRQWINHHQRHWFQNPVSAIVPQSRDNNWCCQPFCIIVNKHFPYPRIGTIELGEVTPHNIKLLRRLNQVIFPVSYNDKFYKDVVESGPLAKLGTLYIYIIYIHFLYSWALH